MANMDETPIKVLLVEDDQSFAYALREALLSGVGSVPLELVHAERLSEALQHLEVGGIDVVLLDLTLPDASGLETAKQARAAAPHVPLVVLTGHDDEGLALKALQEGAQEYLIKGKIDGTTLRRAMRHAIERSRRQSDQAQIQQQEQQDREKRWMDRMSSAAPTAVTAQVFGRASLRESVLPTFDVMVREFEDLLEKAVEQRMYKVEYKTSDVLHAMAQHIGAMNGGPRDVIDVYTTALENKVASLLPQKAQAYTDEGRLMVIELMGYLASYYRQRAALPATQRIRDHRAPALEQE